MTPAPKKQASPMMPDSTPVSEKKANPWLIVSIILAIILIAVFAVKFLQPQNETGEEIVVLSSEEASSTLMDFINKIYAQQIGTATLKDIANENGLYRVTVTVTDPQTNELVDQDVYTTLDGKLFIPQVIDIADILDQFEAYQQQLQAQQQQINTQPDITNEVEGTPTDETEPVVE